jgi:hypothetical protein
LVAENQSAHDLRKRLRVAGTEIFQNIGESTSGAETDDRRRRERYDDSALDLAELGTESFDDLLRPERRILALVEGFQRQHHERGVRLRVIVDEVQADR